MCEECYSDSNRITPLLNPVECLENHIQYICDTCGRCICIERDHNKGVKRWNLPFKTVEIARLYLLTADYTSKKFCGIHEIQSCNGRVSYKIFADIKDLENYLKKNKDKTCLTISPVFSMNDYKQFPKPHVRPSTAQDISNHSGPP